jgi:hypothetical protein
MNERSWRRGRRLGPEPWNLPGDRKDRCSRTETGAAVPVLMRRRVCMTASSTEPTCRCPSSGADAMEVDCGNWSDHCNRRCHLKKEEEFARQVRNAHLAMPSLRSSSVHRYPRFDQRAQTIPVLCKAMGWRSAILACATRTALVRRSPAREHRDGQDVLSSLIWPGRVRMKLPPQ